METKKFSSLESKALQWKRGFLELFEQDFKVDLKSTGMTSAMSKFLRRTAEVGSFAVVCGRHFYDDACRVAGTDKGRQKGIGGD